MSQESREDREAADGIARDPLLFEQCATALGRITVGHQYAERHSAAFRQLESLMTEGRVAEISDESRDEAFKMHVRGHLLACMYYFGPMEREQAFEQLNADRLEVQAMPEDES